MLSTIKAVAQDFWVCRYGVWGSNYISQFCLGAVYLAMLCSDSPELKMDLETESEEDSSQVGTVMSHMFIMHCVQ